MRARWSARCFLRGLSGVLALAIPTGCSAGDTRVGGSGTILGTMDGRDFETVGAAYLIGQPDDPAQTAVVFVLDNPVSCADISSAGWDETVTDGTQSLELKIIGHTGGDYPVAADGRASGGESTDNYTVTSTSATPAEISASSGTVTLDSYAEGGSAAGSFDLSFSTGSLRGSFAATWCADGSEP